MSVPSNQLFLPPQPQTMAVPQQQFVRPQPPQQIQQPPQWTPGKGQPVAATLPPPVIRFQMEDEPPPAKLTLPSPPPAVAQLTLPTPEALGVKAASAAPAVDWNAVKTQLTRLGAIGFQVSQLPQGGSRVTFVLPTARQDRQRHIEATAATEAEAVLAALNAAEPR